MDSELERFKSFDLEALAKTYGFQYVRRRGSIVEMRHEQDGERIDITEGDDGHPVFKSWNREARGSVVDFVMHREGCTLGRARQSLRTYAGNPGSFQRHSSIAPRPASIPHDRASLAAQWQGMRPYGGGYLEGRGIEAATLAAFADRLRLDGRGNVAFRHDDLSGLSGWELKNRGFTGFAKGGRKGLFAARVGNPPRTDPPRLVLAESALDAMSYHQHDPGPGLFLSFGGGLSNDQRALLAHVLTKYPAAQIITATDADEEGDRYAATIAAIRPDATRARPTKGKDWNDTLRPPEPRRKAGATPSSAP